MIPFLKNKQEASVSMPADTIKREPDDESEQEYDGLEAAVEDLCNAIEKKDDKAGASALRAAFELMEAQPHEEASHG